MKKVLISLLIAAFMCGGCALFRKTAIELSEEDLKNAEVSKQVAKNLVKTWPLNSGALTAALASDRTKRLCGDTIDAWAKLDALTDKPPEDLTDKELGQIIGYHFLIYKDMGRQLFQTVLPEVMELLTPILGL